MQTIRPNFFKSSSTKPIQHSSSIVKSSPAIQSCTIIFRPGEHFFLEQLRSTYMKMSPKRSSVCGEYSVLAGVIPPTSATYFQKRPGTHHEHYHAEQFNSGFVWRRQHCRQYVRSGAANRSDLDWLDICPQRLR